MGDSNDYPREVLVQPDGSILVVGQSQGGDFVPNAAITRSLPDGSPDLTFGTGGKVTTPLGAFGGGIEAAALQADGRILLAGDLRQDTFEDLCVLRYLPDGSPDLSFSADGLVTVRTGNLVDTAHAIGVQADGKIVVAGSTRTNGNANILVLRFLPDGTLDPQFSGDGKVVVSLNLTEGTAYALAFQADGKIVVGGSARGGNGFAHLVLLRFDEHGEFDPEFSEDGKLTSDLGLGSGLANALAILPDGKILAAGNSWNGSNNDAVIVRLLDDGTFDPSFSADGVMKISRTPGSEDVLESIFPQEDGTIVAGGRFIAGTTGGFATTRVLADGNLDTAYGTNGIAMVAHGVATERLAAGAVQVNGSLLLAGQGHTEHDTDFLLFRVEGPPEIPYRLWAAANGLTGDAAAPEAMPFGDGVDNLSKYAFNMNGGGPDKSRLQTGTGSSGLPLVAVTREAGGVRLRFEFVRRRSSGLDYRVRRSESLAPGSYLAFGGTTVVSAIDRYWERVVVERLFDPAVMPLNFGVLDVGFPD